MIITNNISSLDETIYKFIYSFHSEKVTNIMKIITFLASTKFIVILSILSLISLWFKNKKCFYIIITIITSTILNNLIKIVIRRPRPNHFRHVIELTYSFPSGHAMASMSFYGSIIVLINNSELNKKYKMLITIILSTLILFIGLSRIYLGVHHASDILGGWLISFILLTFLDKYVKEQRIK